MESSEARMLAETLVELFYPLVEAAVYTDRKTHPEVIYNSLSKKAMTLQEVEQRRFPFIRTLDDGRKVKCTGFRFSNREEWIVLSFDTSLFSQLQQQIASIITLEEDRPHEMGQGREQICRFIENYLQKERITVSGATRSQKRELVLALYQKDLFQFKEASTVIAEMLHTSRATIYNYLHWAKAVRRVRIHQVDTFTDQPFGGNPAGIVLDAEPLGDETMKKITREMNLSETAFVLPGRKGDFRLRYFTPTGDEVKFCGHSTVGALYMIAHEERFGVKGSGNYSFNVETNVGVIPMEVQVKEEGPVTVAFEAPVIDLVNTDYDHKIFCGILGIDEKMVDLSKPVMLEKTNQDIFLTIRSLRDLEKVSPDFRALAAFTKKEKIVAVCLLTTETFDSKNHVHTRVFCPAVGIPEDPFTGSMQGGLAAYLHKNHMFPKKRKLIGVEQGHFLNRPGTVKVQLTEKNGSYRAKIFAQAVHFFSTEVDLI